MPESAFNNHFTHYPQFNNLKSEILGKKLDLIFGGFFLSENNLYNTLFWIREGSSKIQYKKKQPIIGEFLPWPANIILKNLWQFKSITFSLNERPLLQLSQTTTFVPYICSELFFQNNPDEKYKCTILTIANDSWFTHHYMRKLMYLSARLKALSWQRDIIYISYHHAAWFGKEGEKKCLKVHF